jgi:hypothetical protein
MALRAPSAEFGIVFLLVSASTLLCGTALLRVPRSILVWGVCALTVFANAGLVRWCLRNNGNIVISNDELIVKLRTGQAIRRNLHEIQSIQWNRVERRLSKDHLGAESYVRIFTNAETPLQFLWDECRRQRRQSRAKDLIGELQRRLPAVVAVESTTHPEKLKVVHARRNSRTSHALLAFVAVSVCGFTGGVIHGVVPKSSGSAIAVLHRVERSFSRVATTSLPSDLPVTVLSEPCFGSRRRPSYWLEKVFNIEIRRVRTAFAVTADPATAADDARKILPNGWGVNGFDSLPEIMGKRRLYVQSPCLTARRGEFSASLETRFTGVFEKLRAKVDRAQ